MDLGCGVGNLTKKIRELSKGKVTGIDPSVKGSPGPSSRQQKSTLVSLRVQVSR
ncbi:MAG: class I SAM-dependent methyltransferase [bacterium]